MKLTENMKRALVEMLEMREVTDVRMFDNGKIVVEYSPKKEDN